eukprot:345912-Hanusia_phi.AAC.1
MQPSPEQAFYVVGKCEGGEGNRGKEERRGRRGGREEDGRRRKKRGEITMICCSGTGPFMGQCLP